MVQPSQTYTMHLNPCTLTVDTHFPVDIVLVASYNNVMKGHSTDQFINQMRCFKSAVLEMSIWTGEENSFEAVTLPFPPKFTRRNDDPLFSRHDC